MKGLVRSCAALTAVWPVATAFPRLLFPICKWACNFPLLGHREVTPAGGYHLLSSTSGKSGHLVSVGSHAGASLELYGETLANYRQAGDSCHLQGKYGQCKSTDMPWATRVLTLHSAVGEMSLSGPLIVKQEVSVPLPLPHCGPKGWAALHRPLPGCPAVFYMRLTQAEMLSNPSDSSSAFPFKKY